MTKHHLLLLALLLFTFTLPHSTFSAQPNVIIFISDDVSWNDHGCYGNPNVRTPYIDKLAANGLRFDNAYLTASSCSPSRASIITGRYPHNNGKAAELHHPIADHLPWLPEILREQGYYTALSGKNHMTRAQPSDTPPFDFIDPNTRNLHRGGEEGWVAVTQNRPKEKPFFFWFAANDAHRAWDKYWDASKFGPQNDPSKVTVPPFLIDDATTRQDLAYYYDEITRFDYYIGQVVSELERQDILDDTLIFVLADNGRPFPRAKTRLHDSGMKTALVAHWPNGIQSNGPTSSLASVIDLAPTILRAAGAKPGPTFQGVDLSPIFNDRSKNVRRYAFSEHNWHDYEALGRSMRTEQFLYIENSRPTLPQQGPADSVRSDSFKQLLAARDANSLNPAQADVFLAPRPETELYDHTKDPHQLNNLADNPEYARTLKQLAKRLAQWRKQTKDTIPDQISANQFDPITGKKMVQDQSFRYETPGESANAAHSNHPGPR